MEGSSVFIKERLKVVMSPTKDKLKNSHAKTVMTDGEAPVMSTAKFQEQTEKMMDSLAMLKDVLELWPIKMKDGKSAKPIISNDRHVILVALPFFGHDIDDYVMTDGRGDFKVDGKPLIPVMSEDEIKCHDKQESEKS